MTSLEAVLLGVVQGATEFLPVSSSGHLVLTQEILGWNHPDLTFDIWLHLSTLLAVVIFFWKDLWQLTKKKVLMIAVGSIPAAIVGLSFSNAIEGWFGSTRLVAITLLVTGILNIATSKLLKKQRNLEEKQELGFKQSLVIGLFQAMAIIPGISRSGSTVFAGVANKIDRVKAFKFSFFLSLPAILGASLLQLIKVWDQGLESIASSQYLFAALAAFLTGLVSLYIFKFIIKKARLDIFGYYCLAISIGYFFFS